MDAAYQATIICFCHSVGPGLEIHGLARRKSRGILPRPAYGRRVLLIHVNTKPRNRKDLLDYGPGVGGKERRLQRHRRKSALSGTNLAIRPGQ